MTDITNVVSAVITLLVAVITTFLIPYLKEKVDAEKFEKIKAWTKVAVEAAEMIYNGAGRGAEKKAYVLEYLNSKGYKLDSDTIDKLIESAVLELKKIGENLRKNRKTTTLTTSSRPVAKKKNADSISVLYPINKSKGVFDEEHRVRICTFWWSITLNIRTRESSGIIARKIEC